MVPDKDFQFSHTTVDISKHRKSLYEIGRKEIIERLIPHGRQKLAIDIGSGSGYFSRILSHKGWITTAIDTDPQNIKGVRDYVAEAHLGDAISVLSRFPENRYDFALALEIIEHMPLHYGKVLLKNTLRALRPGGILLISTANRFSPEGLGEYFWGEKIRGWRRWMAWDSSHVYIYSSWEIVRILKKSGFAVDKIIGYWYGGRLPLLGQYKLPFKKTAIFPINMMGFDIIVTCIKGRLPRVAASTGFEHCG